MADAIDLQKFDLYGEEAGGTAPEFLHIEPISARSRLHEWTIAPHSHPGIHQVLLLESGSGQLVVDSLDMQLWPRTLIAIPSSCVHAFRFDPASEGWVFSFAVELLHDPRLARGQASSCFEGRSASVEILDSKDPALQRLQWLLADLAREFAGRTSANLSDRQAAQAALVIASAEETLRAADPSPDSDRQRVLSLAFRNMVDANYRAGLSIGEYARRLGTTVPTLNRACRAQLDKAPGEIVRERVLLEAMRYLTFTSAGISQIADDLGFSDPAYFARFFKQRTGIPATRFRKERGWFSQRPKAGSKAQAIRRQGPGTSRTANR